MKLELHFLKESKAENIFVLCSRLLLILIIYLSSCDEENVVHGTAGGNNVGFEPEAFSAVPDEEILCFCKDMCEAV